MDKLTELCEFLAWVQDNYTESGDDWYLSINTNDFKAYSREQVVTHYLAEKGIKDA